MKDIFLSREPVIKADAFIGRQEEVTWIIEMLKRGPLNCSLVGEPRSGKSSLLYHVYQHQQDQFTNNGDNPLFVWIPLLEAAEQSSLAFWRHIFTRFNKALGRSATAYKEETDAAYLYRQLADELELIDRRPVVFFLDDFDVMAPSLTIHDLHWMRALIWRYKEFFAFVSANQFPIHVIEKQTSPDSVAVSPLANLFHEWHMGLLTQAEAQTLIRRAAEIEAFNLTAADEQFLLHEAGYHPNLLKLACYHLFKTASPTESSARYDNARSDFRYDSHVEWLCKTLFERRRADQRQMLLQLAKGSVDADKLEVNARRRLHQMGLIKETGKQFSLFSDAFGYWISRRQTSLPQSEMLVAAHDTAVAPPSDHLIHHPDKRQVIVGKRTIQLTPLENRLLAYLLQHPHDTRTIEELRENVWGGRKSKSVVEKGINRLRAKIEPNANHPRYLLSIYGQGYMLRPDGSPAA
jgi:DNA-binding response OmpR family regulator